MANFIATLSRLTSSTNYLFYVKNERSGLSIFLFSFLIFILFLIYFPLFYF